MCNGTNQHLITETIVRERNRRGEKKNIRTGNRNDKMLIVGAVKIEIAWQIANFRGMFVFFGRRRRVSGSVGQKGFSLAALPSHNGEYGRLGAVQEHETSHRIKFTTFKFWLHRVYRLRPRSNFFPATFVKGKSFDRFTIAVQTKINLTSNSRASTAGRIISSRRIEWRTPQILQFLMFE